MSVAQSFRNALGGAVPGEGLRQWIRVERGSAKDSVVHGFPTRQIYPNEKKGDSDQCNTIGVSKWECVMQSAG